MYAPIDTATIGANQIVAGVPGKIIRVLNYTLLAAGPVTAQFLGGATELTGAMSLIAGIPVSPSQGPMHVTARAALFEAAVGTALNLTLGGAVQVSGHVEYEFRQT
jgi:hypothetical protein